MHAPVGVIGIRHRAFAFAGALVVLPEEGKAFGVGIRERAEEGSVGESEDGGIGTDADGQYCNNQ